MIKRLKVTLTRLAYSVLIVFLVMSIAPGSARAINCTTVTNKLNLQNNTTYKNALDKIWIERTADSSNQTRKTKNDETCFLVPVITNDKDYTKFIVRSRDLYILGFQTGDKIYAFQDKDLPTAPNTPRFVLPYDGNYNTIYPEHMRGKKFNSSSIETELETLNKATTEGDKIKGDPNKFKKGLAYGAFFISESLRFKQVNTTFTEVFNNSKSTEITFNDKLAPYVLQWGKCSQVYLFGESPGQKESAGELLKTANGNIKVPTTIPNCNNTQSSH